MWCTCPDGLKKQMCKHVVALFTTFTVGSIWLPQCDAVDLSGPVPCFRLRASTKQS